MQEPLSILHICNYYFGSKVHVELFDHMIKLCPNMKVYAAYCERTKLKNLDREYLIANQDYRYIDRINFFNKSKKIRDGLKKNINLKDIDIIHAHTVFTDGYVAYKIYKELNIPYVVAVRNTDINAFFKIYKNTGKKILLNAKKIVCLSEAYRKRILEFFDIDTKEIINRKCAVIPNGIDDFWFTYPKLDKRKKKEEITIITSANFDKNKNLEVILKACDMLKQEQKIKLLVCGNLMYKEIYEEILKRSYVEYLGFIDKKTFADYLDESDVFVLLSYYETFGLVYAEALSRGVPVIYTKNEGFDEQFEEGKVGHSCNPNDYVKLKELIVLGKSKQIKSNMVSKFNWSNISKEYIVNYREIIK